VIGRNGRKFKQISEKSARAGGLRAGRMAGVVYSSARGVCRTLDLTLIRSISASLSGEEAKAATTQGIAPR
jgi:hypothetical protein